jgi:hypothetical protein
MAVSWARYLRDDRIEGWSFLVQQKLLESQARQDLAAAVALHRLVLRQAPLSLALPTFVHYILRQSPNKLQREYLYLWKEQKALILP